VGDVPQATAPAENIPAKSEEKPVEPAQKD
jgi:preprotein translocase subunit SecG